jgi:dUTP pyrophosphatase
MKVAIKKLHPEAVIPEYAKDGDAGLDFTAVAMEFNANYNYIEYFTGIAIEVPEGHVGLMFPRSSVSKTDLALTNCVGVIDSGYRGEIKFRYRFPKDMNYPMIRKYQEGERIGQLIIMPYPQIELEEVSELSDSERGDGGFGSSGN